MKRKLLLLIAALLCAVGTWATDVKRDVTSYITNPSFEDDAKEITLTNDNMSDAITGWVVTGLNSANTHDNGIFNKSGHALTNADGDYIFNAWGWWQGNPTVKQTVNLPKGSYKLTAYLDTDADKTMRLYANEWNSESKGNGDNSGKLMEVSFSLSEETDVEIGAVNTDWGWNFLKADNFKLYAMDLAAASQDLPNTAVTAGTWYKFTTGSSSDAYLLSSNGDATITYTTDGTLSDDAGIEDTWTLTANQIISLSLAPSTTYYIKSNNPVTLTTKSSVNSSLVSGWTKVTSLSDLHTNPENYFYAIFSANNPGLILDASSSNGSSKLYYKTAANPLSSSAYLFELENYGESGGFAMKSVSWGNYFANSSGNPWDYMATKTTTDDDCEITMTLANGVYTLQDKYTDGGNHYLGLWTPEHGYVNGEDLAGNKGDAEKGSFIIYRIAKVGLNMTSLITNPSFELKSANTNQDAVVTSSGSTALSIYGWTENLNGINDLRNSDWVNSTTKGSSSRFADAITSADGTWHYYARKGWSNSNTVDISLTSNEMTLPKGHYELSYQYLLEENYRDNDPSSGSFLTLKVMNGATQVAAQESSKANTRKSETPTYTDTSWKTSSVSFNVTDETLTVTAVLALSPRGGVNTEVHVDNFNLTYSPFAEAADYTDLAAAITVAEAKTLGFEDGQYAPYNNVAALTALATAKAIDPDVTNGKKTVQDATTALVEANTSGWTANSGDVDAIYNQDFNTASDGWNPDGWTSSGWAARVSDINSSTTISKTGNGWRPNTGTITYGNTGVYTMPLAGNQLYKLTFKYGAWDNWSVPTISVLKAEDGLAATVLPGTSTNYKTAMNTWTMYFKTGDAGNYILSMNATFNMVYTDVSLVKATEEEITLSSGVPATSTFYQTLKLDRTFSDAKWSTLCVPFAFDKSNFDKVVELQSITGSGSDINMTFSEASTIVAGKPYLVKAKNDGDHLTATNVTLPGASVQESYATAGGYRVDFVGTQTDAYLTAAANSNAWVVSNNNLYNVDSNVTVGAYRGYFTVSGSGVKAMSFDFDNATGITETTEKTEGTESLFDLSGRRVSKAQKGLYIMNGKKVMVK